MFALIAFSLLAVTTLVAPPTKAAAVVQPPQTHPFRFPSERKIYGFVESINAQTLLLENRYRKTIVVDVRNARASIRIYPGRSIIVYGTMDAAGVVHATAIWRTFPEDTHWPADH